MAGKAKSNKPNAANPTKIKKRFISIFATIRKAPALQELLLLRCSVSLNDWAFINNGVIDINCYQIRT